MASTYIQKVRAEQVLLGTVTDLHLSYSDEVLIFANVIRKAFVTKGVDFASNDKTICPNFYEHITNIKIFPNWKKIKTKFFTFFDRKEYFIEEYCHSHL